MVRGLVQGVYFRHYTAKKANELGLHGWVRNLRDGKVELVCEGLEDKVEKMVNWCRKGPEEAYVEGIDVMWEDCTGEFTTFQIVY